MSDCPCFNLERVEAATSGSRTSVTYPGDWQARGHGYAYSGVRGKTRHGKEDNSFEIGLGQREPCVGLGDANPFLQLGLQYRSRHI